MPPVAETKELSPGQITVGLAEAIIFGAESTVSVPRKGALTQPKELVPTTL